MCVILYRWGIWLLCIFRLNNQVQDLRPENGQLEILYEDQALIIVDKPAGQSTIPSRDHPSGTVANLVAGKFPRERLPATVHVVTRLEGIRQDLFVLQKTGISIIY